MSNSFTDFFETLLPREITLYVVPGSLVLSITVWLGSLHNPEFKLNHFFKENLSLRSTNLGVIDYIFFGAIWIAATYLIGLIVGGLKQGWFRKIEKGIVNLLKIKPKSKVRGRGEFIKVSVREEYKESGSKSLYTREDVDIFTQDLDEERIEKPILPLPSKQLSQRECLGMQAMYLAIGEEKMYRREIERYGVLSEAIENIIVSLIIVGIIVGIWGKEPVKQIYGLILPILAYFLLIPGAQGYRKLQEFRIKTMFEALEKKKRDKIDN